MTSASPDLTVAELLNPQHANASDRARVLADALAGAVRCLNYATRGPGLVCPADTDAVLGGLAAAVYGLDQTLRQVAVDDGHFAGDPAAAAATARAALRQARSHAGALGHAVDRARQTTAVMSAAGDTDAGEGRSA